MNDLMKRFIDGVRWIWSWTIILTLVSLLFFLAYISIIILGEIEKRDSFYKEINNDYIVNLEISKLVNDALHNVGGDVIADTKLKRNVARSKQARDRVAELIRGGEYKEKPWTLRAIRCDYYGTQEEASDCENIRTLTKSSSKNTSYLANDYAEEGVFGMRVIKSTNSSNLTGFLTVLVAIIGAMVAIFRGDKKIRENIVEIGARLSAAIGAGFLIYLVINSGQIDVLSDERVTGYSSNTSAFAGFLAGYFSEQLYDLLTNLVEFLKMKVRGYFQFNVDRGK